jgi:hypothetical protein
MKISNKLLAVSAIILLMMATACFVVYQLWFGDKMEAALASVVLVVEALLVCYCTQLYDMFKTLDRVEDLMSD